MSLTIDLEAARTAMCLWEALLEVQIDTANRNVIGELGGAYAARDLCLDLAIPCNDCWEIANALGYDDSFDWNFVPQWLDLYLASGRPASEAEWQAANRDWAARIYDRYLEDNPRWDDEYYVQPCVARRDLADDEEVRRAEPNETPQFWGVYARRADGTSEWKADFPTKAAAEAWAIWAKGASC